MATMPTPEATTSGAVDPVVAGPMGQPLAAPVALSPAASELLEPPSSEDRAITSTPATPARTPIRATTASGARRRRRCVGGELPVSGTTGSVTSGRIDLD